MKRLIITYKCDTQLQFDLLYDDSLNRKIKRLIKAINKYDTKDLLKITDYVDVVSCTPTDTWVSKLNILSVVVVDVSEDISDYEDGDKLNTEEDWYR